MSDRGEIPDPPVVPFPSLCWDCFARMKTERFCFITDCWIERCPNGCLQAYAPAMAYWNGYEWVPL